MARDEPMVDRRRNALVISPVMPDPNGKGIARRAFWTLAAFARDHRTYLLVLPLGREDAGETPTETATLAEAVHVSPKGAAPRLAAMAFAGVSAAPAPFWPTWAEPALKAFSEPTAWRTLTRARLRKAAQAFSGVAFDHVHTFRLYTAPATFAWLERFQQDGGARPFLSLDIDDIESLTHQRFAEVHETRGERKDAAVARRAAAIYRRLEDVYAPKFDRLIICSDTDRDLLAERFGDSAPEIRVAPNVVDTAERIRPAPNGSPFRFLFVGTLRYLPNADGLRFFLEEVAPDLDAAIGAEAWTLDIVGRGGREAVSSAVAAHPRVRLIEEAPEMAPAYERADAVIAPIRAGGGTRIKILEAFAFGRPVVSTTLGAEGIAAEHGRDLLLADEPVDFAAQCAALVRDADLRARMTEAAAALVAERYSPDAIARGLVG